MSHCHHRQRGLPPRVELFVNRGEAARNLDTTLLNLLQPLFANGLGGSGGTAVMGDYVVGDMASLIEQLMRNDQNRVWIRVPIYSTVYPGCRP